MKSKAYIIFAIIALITSVGCSRSTEVSFGLVKGDEIIETRRIEYKIGEEYGYQIYFNSDLGKVRLREEFVLPGPAPWGHDEPPEELKTLEKEVSKEGSRLIEEVEFDAVAGTGWIQGYTIIENDPTGPHVIRLWLDDDLLEIFEFTIE